MIQITPHMRILLCVKPVDFRRGIDGLAQVCKSIMKTDPFSGAVFIFRNKKATSIKILLYDTQGFCLFQKRLSKGRFTWWPNNMSFAVKALDVHELQLLLWNGDPSKAQVAPPWRKIKMPNSF